MSGIMETFYINTELKNGNIAIAAMLFGAFYATSAVISQAVVLSQPMLLQSLLLLDLLRMTI
ncbi:hypothetical protein Ahos_1930 [Acidianus hospitalis W1]|uniref:Uncharacterized protein n=2 Tax=Acidianus hospitalis TaxID=563177 RepID=F4B7Q6_ACIHW|nr:hypothetical protein Ahos_1930 [Acidianus hospitalis W1]